MRNFLTPITVLTPTAGSNPVTKTFLELGYRYTSLQTLTSGTTYNRLADARFIIVEGVGGGAGGGGVDGQGAGTTAASGGGGGGGWFRLYIPNPLSSYTIAIGAGGGGGSGLNGTNGSDGGTTSFSGGGNTATATGGGGGIGRIGTSGSVATTSGTPGIGSISGFTGITGGSWQGPGANISSGTLFQNSISGCSLYGGQLKAQINVTGADATIYGAGGAGASTTDLTNNYAGGDGEQGVIYVWEFL